MVNAERIPNGYRITEAGILPAEWQVKRLSEVATELTERAGHDMYETVSISAGIGFVNQAKKFGKELSGKQYEKYIVLHKGDFSYNKGNSKTSPQGCIYRLNDRESAAVPNVFESFRIKEQDADYYEQLFLSGFLNKQLYSRINRGVRDDGLLNLTGKDFYGCMVPVPPKDEQKRIAEVLLCCDRVIDLKQQLIAELQRLKNGFLQTMFPAKGRSKPNIRFPGFVDAWEQRKLGKLVKFSKGTGYSKGDLKEFGTPIILYGRLYTNYETVIKDVDTFVDAKNGSVYSRGGEVIVPASGETAEDISVASVVEKSGILLGGDLNIITPPSELDSAFLALSISNGKPHNDMAKMAQGKSIVHLRNSDLEKIELAYPSYEEQVQISTYFRYLDHLITLHQRELEEMKKKKKSLAKLLLTGGVRVPT